MAISAKPVQAYISAVERPLADQYLQANGFGQGMVLFALPEYGILFKCLAKGKLIDLEFGAFFALLKFVETSLAAEKITALTVLSSNPEFVFSFSPQSRHLPPGSERERLLKGHTAKVKFTVSYIEPTRNQARVSPVDYPSMPDGKTVKLRTKLAEPSVSAFKPIQKGIKI